MAFPVHPGQANAPVPITLYESGNVIELLVHKAFVYKMLRRADSDLDSARLLFNRHRGILSRRNKKKIFNPFFE
jgi:hypothetical protein